MRFWKSTPLTGKKKVILNFTAPVLDENGAIQCAIVANLDITERKRMEEKLKENAGLLKIAGEKAKLGGWSVDLKNNLCIWSDETAAIHERPAGYSPFGGRGDKLLCAGVAGKNNKSIHRMRPETAFPMMRKWRSSLPTASGSGCRQWANR